MTLLKIDSRMHSHPKIVKAGNASVGLWVRLACWAVRYHPGDWQVPGVLVRNYSTQNQLRRLIAAELITPIGDNYELDSELLSFARDDYRTPIPAEQRARIYERDGHRCLECGATYDLTLDHIYPWSLGGRDTDDNLRTLCRPCNSRKGAKV